MLDYKGKNILILFIMARTKKDMREIFKTAEKMKNASQKKTVQEMIKGCSRRVKKSVLDSIDFSNI